MRRVTLTKYLFRTLMDSVDNPQKLLNGHQRRRVAQWWEKLDPLMATYNAELDKIDAWRSKENAKANFNFQLIVQNNSVRDWKVEAIDHEFGGWIDGDPVNIVVSDEDFGAIKALWQPEKEEDDAKVGGPHWRKAIGKINAALADAAYVTEKELAEQDPTRGGRSIAQAIADREAEKPDNGMPDNVKELVKAGKKKEY